MLVLELTINELKRALDISDDKHVAMIKVGRKLDGAEKNMKHRDKRFTHRYSTTYYPAKVKIYFGDEGEMKVK